MTAAMWSFAAQHSPGISGSTLRAPAAFLSTDSTMDLYSEAGRASRCRSSHPQCCTCAHQAEFL